MEQPHQTPSTQGPGSITEEGAERPYESEVEDDNQETMHSRHNKAGALTNSQQL